MSGKVKAKMMTKGRNKKAAFSASAIPALAAAPDDAGIMPLEPRIMMDAVLDLGLDSYFHNAGSDAIADLLNLAGQVSEQLSTFADGLTSDLTQQLGSAADLFVSAGDNPYETGVGSAVEDAFAALTSLGNALGESILGDLSGKISSVLDSVLEQMKIEFGHATKTYFDGLSDDNKGQVFQVINQSLEKLDGSSLLHARQSFATILNQAEEEAIRLSTSQLPNATRPDFFTDAQRDAMSGALRQDFIGRIANSLASEAAGSIDTKIDLKDVKSGDNTLVAFTQDGAKVDVTVDFGQMLADFASIFDKLGLSGDTVTNWADLLPAPGGVTFGFELSATTVEAGGDFSTIINLGNFDTSGLSFGGDVAAGIVDGLNFTAGMFSAGVEAIHLAKFDLAFGGPVTLAFSSADFNVTLDTGADRFLGINVTEAGASAAKAFDAAASYTYASIDFTAQLDWGLDNVFTDTTAAIPHAFRIDGAFALVGSSSTLAIHTDAAVSALDNDGHTIIPSAENQARLDQLTETVLGFARLDGSALVDALTTAVSGLDVLFHGDVFNFDLPLLQGFNLSALTNIYQTLSSVLLKPMNVDLDVLGLTSGTDTATNNQLLISGVVADPATGHVFADQAGQTLTIILNAQTAAKNHAFDISVQVPDGGFDSVKAYAAALKAAVAEVDASVFGAGKTLKDFLAINEVRGDIELRGTSLSGFSLSGAATTLALLGVAAANDTARFGAPLSGQGLTDLLESSWMKAFQLNLELTRTVSYADGTTEAISYRTFTLNPQDGGWTVPGLVDQFNAYFNAAGITMTAVDADGALEFEVNQNAAADRYGKAGTSITDTAFTFAIDGAKASVASSVEALQAYVNETIAGVIPGAALDIDIRTGEVVLRLPDIAFAIETQLEAALATNLGALAQVDLKAAFALLAEFSLGFDIGVALKELIGAPAGTSVADHIFLENVKFQAEVSARADNITGKGQLGIVEVVLGDAVDNRVEVGARLEAGVVGQDADGSYSGRVSFDDLMKGANTAAGIAALLGTFDLVGTVDTNGDAIGDSFALISLHDISVGISGVNIGIEKDAIRSFEASLKDVFKPADWTLDIDSPVANLIAGLGKDDFVDTLYNSLILVDQLLNGMAKDLGFLGGDIPVLGVSVLDAMSFAKDLAAQLQGFKASPNAGLSEISASLAQSFGLDSDELKLLWDDAHSVFYVSLDLNFIDAPLSYDFQLDLAELLGGMAGSNTAIANLLSVASSLGNVTGDGRIVLDASLGFDLTFGLDLSSVMGSNVGAVTTATALAAMSGISQLSYNTANSGHNGRDALISVVRTGSGAPEYIDIKVELDDAVSVGQAVSRLHEALVGAKHDTDIGIEITGKNAAGDTVRIMVDAANRDLVGFGVAGLTIDAIGFVDLAVHPVDFAGVGSLFGIGAPTDAQDATFTSVDLGTIDASRAYQFSLQINGSDAIELSIAATAGRDAAGLVVAVQAALAATAVSRSDVGLGLPSTIKLDQLLSASLQDGRMVLGATNFAEAIGKEQIALTLTGSATGQSSSVTISDLGGSNLMRALGFAADSEGAATGDLALMGNALEARLHDDGVRAFIVTDALEVNGVELGGTGIHFEFIAGIEDGLNMTLALGPLSVSVVDGKVLIGDGNGGKAFVDFGINDQADAYLGDGADSDGRVYFGAVLDMISGDAPTALTDLFSFNAKAALELVLPLQDSLGLLKAVDNAGVTIRGDLFVADGSFRDATGAMVAIFDSSQSVSDYLDVEIVLPSFDEILENLNPFAIINDPLLLTNGLDMILTSLDKTLRSVIKAMNLPIVGDAMTQGLTVFNDMARAILQPIQEAANTPNPDGTMPTTIDLIERVVNGALKSLFGVNQDVIRAVLTEDMNNPSIIAEIFLEDFTIFEAALDVGFDLGIPGFNLAVGQNSALMFEVLANINIAFGIDKNGFFFLNDTDAPEIVIHALVKTSEGFTAAASLGLVGMALTANKLENHGFGDEDIYGAVIGGKIEIDLFTSLGKAFDLSQYDDEVADYGRGNGYENIVRLNELSTGKSSTGEGTKLVSISGEFEVHVDLHLTTSIVNPVTGAVINELPSALADLVLDAHYRIGGELDMVRLEFQDVGIYAGDFLAENVLPVLQQINEYVAPIADMVQFLKDTAIGGYSLYDLLADTVGRVYPAALFVFEAIDTISSVIKFIDGIGPDATIYFGSFSLLSPASNTGVIDTGNSKTMGSLRPGSGVSHSSSFSLDANSVMSNKKPGIGFDFLIFNDVSNVLNLLTGNLAAVELFEVDVTLLDFTANIDLKAAIKSAVSFLPGQVIDVLFGGFQASFYVHAEAGITVGYDLYGIAEFLGSGKVVDILDGMYFDAERPLLQLEASFNVGIGINLAIIKAGIELSGYFGLEISMNDPNADGKLRLGEMIWVIDNHSMLDLFEGEIKLGLEFGVYFKLDFFFFSVGGEWSWTLLDFSEHFGKDFTKAPNYIATGADGVSTLNIGASAGQQVGGNTVDGDDVIEFNGDMAYINGKAVGKVGDTVLIYAGQGNNVIDVSGLSSGIKFQIITGDGNDRIVVGDSSGLISTGAGNDQVLYKNEALNYAAMGLMGFGAFVGGGAAAASPSSFAQVMPSTTAPTSNGAVRDRLPASSTQELVILSNGNVNIDLSGSHADTIVVATEMDIIGDTGERVLLSDWAKTKFQGAEPDMAQVRAKIDQAMLTFTADSQTRADTGNSTIRTGTGNDIIFTGRGDDVVIDQGGSNIVFTGAGNDQVILRGSGNNWVEAGAGADLVLGGSGNDTIMGWGRYDASTTAAEYATALSHMSAQQRADFAELVRTLVIEDGNDWLEGGDGNDIIAGNGGSRNVIIGGQGDDLLLSGTGHDILAGGDITILSGGKIIDQQADFNPVGKFTVSTGLGVDGNDRLYGSAGNNVLIGGGGDDWLEGVAGTDVLIGDFATVTLSGNSTVLSVVSTHIDATQQGNDTIQGGALADVIVGGGGLDLISAGNGRNVIIGDNAELTSTNLFQGVTKLVSLKGALDDADTIYSGITSAIIVGGGSRQSHGDYISTGHFYGAALSSAVQGVIILADYGDLEGALLVPAIITSTFTDFGDDDVLLTGAGNDILIGGAGADTVTSTGGEDIVFGDSGIVDNITLSGSSSARSLAFERGGDDVITLGNGRNVVIGGDGSDTITAGDGSNLIIGDNAEVLYAFGNDGLRFLHAAGLAAAVGGRDTIRTGSGDDTIVGGQDSDVIDADSGNDLVVGDWAIVDFVERSIQAQAPQHGGADLIAGGDGQDIIIGGWGGDLLIGGGGANVLVGDYASLTWSGRFDVATLVLDAIDVFGNDQIWAGQIDSRALSQAVAEMFGYDVFWASIDPHFASGTQVDGNSFAVGGRGADVLVGGEANDLLFGDWGVFVFNSPVVQPGVAAFDRLYSAESTENWASYDDKLYGNGGRDVLIAGDGNDLVMGGDGQDLIAADAAIYINYRNGWELLETRYPFDGGDDVIDGGQGNDVIVSGFFNFPKRGAGDFLYGNTIEDFMMGTSGSILMHEGKVIRFNYLGMETQELISSNQLGASAGVLMRPVRPAEAASAALPQMEPIAARTLGEAFGFDPEAEISRQDEPLVLQFDVVMRAVLIEKDMLQLLEMYRKGTISADDLEEAIESAVLVKLADRYGHKVPDRILAMLERYLDLLVEQLDPANEDGAVVEGPQDGPSQATA